MTAIGARAVQQAMAAEDSFVAINNSISQSVPHLHVRAGEVIRRALVVDKAAPTH